MLIDNEGQDVWAYYRPHFYIAYSFIRHAVDAKRFSH